MNKKENEELNQKIDNELKKIELSKKYGGNFMEGSSLSPIMEKEWLNYIEEYEKQFHDADQISVWEYIGKPDYQSIDELNQINITKELQRLFDIMHENNIHLDVLSEVDDKEIYRFITEELFIEEIDNMNIPGMTTNFIYEEFHPNARHDIEMAFEYFFRSTMQKDINIDGKGFDLLYVDTKNYTNEKNELVDEKIVIEKINTFLNSFDYFELISVEIQQITINQEETDAQIDFTLHYTGRFNKSSESFPYQGAAIFKLKPSEYGGWSIYYIKMPGLAI